MTKEPPNQSTETIRVLIVDDHPLVAEGLRVALDGEGDIKVVATVRSANDARESVGRLRPDVVLMDYTLEMTDGLELACELKETFPDTRVILITGHRDESIAVKAVALELDGFVRKTASLAVVTAAVRQAHSGEPAFSAADLRLAVRHLRAPQASPTDLTEREFEVLRLLAKGVSTAAMASELYVSTNTIRSHVRHILEKLGAHSKLEAVSIATRDGLIAPAGW